ncbi:hypothetical protein [Methanoculleus sp.]|jgi:hypothetical protein|uniref:hypothetical protein n=1 Tax=Methanoculleus sp. TaxID=90427 RepID=UPI001BD5A9F7|nr:hypothetical protein [Methanoculleus sp.]
MAKNQRADVKNPNNPAYKAAMDNRANQLNPNNAATKSGRGKKVPGKRCSFVQRGHPMLRLLTLQSVFVLIACNRR